MRSTSPKDVCVPTKPLRLLIADDANDLDLCLRDLRKSGIPFEAETVSTRDDFVRTLSAQPFDVVLSGYHMKDWTGMDALSIVKEICPEVPLILLTGTLGDAVVVECMKMGVADCVMKEQFARLRTAVLRAWDEKSLRPAETRALEALRESEEHYRTIVQNAPEAIVLLEVDNARFIDCNDRALWLFRLTREELLRSKVTDLSAPRQHDSRDPERRLQELTQEALEGATPHFEWRCRTSDGVDFPAEVHLVRLLSATRRLIRISITDITERKSSEAALRASEARYRGLVNHATYGILWVREPEGELLDVNPTLAKMLGYESPAQLMAIRFTKELYCNPADQIEIIAGYMTHGRAQATVDWKRRDGKTISVRITGWRGMDPDGESDCAEVIVEDVTERRELEKRLVQAQKFEAIGQLAGGIAHDFNNMIGAILGWAEIGIEETEAGSRLRRHFEKVRHQTDRAAALTRQLLAFARRQILEPRNIDLNKTAVETLSLLEKVIGSNIEIKANLAPDLAVVRADPTQVDQVLMNLCINARDAMPEGGSLVINTSNVTLDEQFCALQPLAHPGGYAVLSVTNTGTGMDAATLDRIFEPFFTTKELGKGTGLGLATVYGIIRQHGGFLHVYSEPGLAALSAPICP